jgi:hypothetical protein
MVFLWELSSLAVDYSRDDTDDDRDCKWEDTAFRLMDAAVALRCPFDDPIGAIAK